MLYYLRQNKQYVGTLVLTMLLMVWLSLTCQNCFAGSGADVIEDASSMHASMECCSEEGHSDHDDTGFDHKSCELNHLTSQPAVADKAVMQFGDQIIVLSLASVHGSPPPISDSGHRAGLSQDAYFSPRLFSSYRILLI